jgi:hypothetical protein
VGETTAWTSSTLPPLIGFNRTPSSTSALPHREHPGSGTRPR